MIEFGKLLIGIVGYGISVMFLAAFVGCLIGFAQASNSPLGIDSSGDTADKNTRLALKFILWALVSASVVTTILLLLEKIS